jgi:hypothetical protein
LLLGLLQPDAPPENLPDEESRTMTRDRLGIDGDDIS